MAFDQAVGQAIPGVSSLEGGITRGTAQCPRAHVPFFASFDFVCKASDNVIRQRRPGGRFTEFLATTEWKSSSAMLFEACSRN